MIILKGGEVHPISRAPFVGDVAFEGGKIVEVGQDIFVPGAEIVDVRGKFVMPGLVDAHSHVGLEETGSREKDHNEKGRPITPEMRGIDAIHPADAGFAGCRSVGITTAVTGPGSINLIGGSVTIKDCDGDDLECKFHDASADGHELSSDALEARPENEQDIEDKEERNVPDKVFGSGGNDLAVARSGYPPNEVYTQ